jgi:AbiV family abortive infection protein
VKEGVLLVYRGRLTPEEAAEGIRIALENAKALLRDAELLLENGRWARAASLSILAIEEASKPSILRAILLARSDQDLKREWRAFRTHTAKNFMARFAKYAAPGATLEDFGELMEDEAAHREIDELKQLGFYTDTHAPGAWVIPDQVFGERASRALVGTARLAVGTTAGAMTSAAELRLWVKYLGPVWRTTSHAMKEALAACYTKAADEGVLRGDQSAARMVEFLDNVSQSGD